MAADLGGNRGGVGGLPEGVQIGGVVWRSGREEGRAEEIAVLEG